MLLDISMNAVNDTQSQGAGLSHMDEQRADPLHEQGVERNIHTSRLEEQRIRQIG